MVGLKSNAWQQNRVSCGSDDRLFQARSEVHNGEPCVGNPCCPAGLPSTVYFLVVVAGIPLLLVVARCGAQEQQQDKKKQQEGALVYGQKLTPWC